MLGHMLLMHFLLAVVFHDFGICHNMCPFLFSLLRSFVKTTHFSNVIMVNKETLGNIAKLTTDN